MHASPLQKRPMFTYHVYLNWRMPGGLARVHFSHCPFCNSGRGIHPRASNRSGRWYGPFADYSNAYDAARQLGRYRAKCQHCRPQRMDR